MPPIAAPSDKRFRRSHVKPGSRRGARLRQVGRALRSAALLAATVYAGWRAVALIGSSHALRVDGIQVSGNERLSSGEVLALVDGLRGEHILRVSLEHWQTALLASPWVESASLRRVLPSTIEVTVRERRPVAVGRLGSSVYLIDAAGVVIDEYGPAYADLDLPIVDGLAGKGGRATVDPARAALAARVVEAVTARPELGRKVSQIDVTDPHDAVVLLDGDTVLLRLGEEAFAERLQQYLDLRQALQERVAAIDYVDLRFGERLYVRPIKGATVAPVSASAK